MAVSASFHKNMHLLSQLASPSEDFKLHYREGMFDKPNTTGFIHVTQFLFSLYDIERFRKLVEWPIVCKKSEAKYRTDVKDFIGLVASEHPEANFPSILATHLLHAGGTKFIRIMWKLSQVVLHVYMGRESQNDILSIPQSGIAIEATKSLLNKSITRNYENIIKLDEKFSQTELRARSTAEREVLRIQNIQKEFFERRRTISEIATKAPVAPFVRKRLADTEDNEIIEMWKGNIQSEISNLKDRNMILNSIEQLSQEVIDLSNSLLSCSKILDVSRLPKIDTTMDLHSMVSPESQVSFSRLYIEEQLSLNNLFRVVLTLLHSLAKQLQIRRLQNLSHCRLPIQTSSQDMISMRDFFGDLLEETVNLNSAFQQRLANENVKYGHDRTDCILGVMDDVLFMPSPMISIDTNPTSDIDIKNRLALTPTEGVYKTLFVRHRRTKDTTPQSSKMKTNLLVSRINFDDTLSSIKSDKTPQKWNPKMPSRLQMNVTKKSEKYSRLFSGYRKTPSKRVNLSMMSIPSTPKANSTQLINTNGESNSIPELTLDFTAKNIFNLSKDIISAVSAITNSNRNSPSQHDKSGTPITERISENKTGEVNRNVQRDKICEMENENDEDSSLINGISNKVIRPTLDDDKEIEVVTKSTTNNGSTQKHKRRSISDFVEHWKKVIDTYKIPPHLEWNENGNEIK